MRFLKLLILAVVVAMPTQHNIMAQIVNPRDSCTSSAYIDSIMDYPSRICQEIVVTTDTVSVNLYPFVECPPMDKIPEGRLLYVIRKERFGSNSDLWYFVETTDAYNGTTCCGFVEARNVMNVEASVHFHDFPDHYNSMNSIYVTQPSFLKQRQLENAKIIRELDIGTLFTVIGADYYKSYNNEPIYWLLIKVDGEIGWILSCDTNFDFNLYKEEILPQY